MGIPRAEVTFDAAKVRELLVEQHPDLAEMSLSEAPSGWDNAMFRLGENLAVRLPRREAAAALVLNEQRWLPQLAPHLRIKAPVPIRVGTPQGWYPWSWSIVPWIDGRTADIDVPRDDQAGVLADFFETLHRPASPGAPHNPYRGVPLRQREPDFRQRVAKLRSRTRAIDTPVLSLWADALAAPDCVAPTWLHGDLHPRNVLCRQGCIAGIIDWGDVAQGDRASDLAAIWMLLPGIEMRRRAMAACATVAKETWVRARGWAVLYAAVFLDASLESDPGMTAIAQRTLERLRQGP